MNPLINGTLRGDIMSFGYVCSKEILRIYYGPSNVVSINYEEAGELIIGLIQSMALRGHVSPAVFTPETLERLAIKYKGNL